MKMSGLKFVLPLSAVLLVSFPACAKKQITQRQRKEAEHAASEGEFAMSIRDWKRAEESLSKATQLSPDIGAYWVSLGSARVRAGNRAAAKDAYQNALKCFVSETQLYKDKPDGWYKQAHMLALMGRAEEGRAVLQQAAKRFPNDLKLRTFIETKQYDRLMEHADFKQMAL